MTIGAVFLSLCLIFALGASFSWGIKKVSAGRSLALASFFAVLMAGVLLFWLILSDRFDIDYVWSYSSLDLPLLYKISVFWAGQQGSFLLWLLFHASAGVLLVWRGRLASRGLAVFFFLQSLLAALVLFYSPFFVTEGYAPTDGAGMNPLLQDPWMAVHPPLVFLGYALLAVPYAASLGTLLSDEPDSREWLSFARSWSLGAWALLGAGIFVGAFWAYKVLGWGGWWGWDPVENSSLVPWLAAGVLVHILRIARVRAANLALAHLAAIFAYALALYGTFLARSGLLGDFSVHSFSGTSVGLGLAVVDAFVLLAGLVLLARYAGRFPRGEQYPAHGSREFWLLLGCLWLCFIAFIVFIGMSMPLITALWGDPAAVGTGFYFRTTAPLAVLLLFAMVPGVLFLYGIGKKAASWHLPALAAVLGGAAALLLGLRDVQELLLAAAAAAVLVASRISWRRGALSPAASLAHQGTAMALFAMALSSAGAGSTLEFLPDEPQQVLGHEIVYRGMELTETRRQKEYVFSVDGAEARALTKLSARGEEAAREPAIAHGPAGDVYIAPAPVAVGHEVVLRRGGFLLEGELGYRLERVEEEPDPDDAGRRIFLVHIAVTDGETVELLEASLVASGMKASTEAVPVLGGQRRLRVVGISENRKEVMVQILPAIEEEARLPLTASVSEKPLLWLLWLGAAFAFGGTAFAAAKATRQET